MTDGAGIRVMVVDDHPMWRDAVERDLAAAGFEVVGVAATGTEALARFPACRPQVVVLDLQIPGPNGVEVTAEVLSQDPSARVLILSASGEQSDVLDAVKAGATGYLVKSASRAELLDAVRRVADGDTVFTAGLAGLVLGEFRRLNEVGPPADPAHPELTERETEVLRMVAKGMSYKQIAERLVLSHRTVQNHVQNTLRKLQMHNRVELTRYAIERGLDEPDPGVTVTGAAYLRRIGVEDDLPPTLATLRLVHRAHLDAVPYENLGIMLAAVTGVAAPAVDTEACVARVAEVGRAGYCFHQNAALGAGLEALGFDVTRRHGHVWTLPEHREAPDLNHLVLLVHGLPTEDNPGGRWWPDAGLGEGFREPVALVDGTFEDGGFTYALDGVDDAGWSFAHASGGSFRGIEVTGRPVGPTEVAAAHRELSTPPDGHFARLVVVQRRHDTHYDSLRGCVLARVTGDSRDEQDVASYDEWRAALVDVLGLPLDDVPDDALRTVWSRTWDSHRAWDRAGRP